MTGLATVEIRRYRRTIFLGDFRACEKFVQFILKEKLYQKTTDRSQLVRLAFETSLVISYLRPFGPNNELPGDGCYSLEAAVKDALPDEHEQKLHALLKNRRDHVYAHSDASAHLIPDFNYDGSPIHPMVIHERLAEPQLRLLQTMIGKWITYLITARPEGVLRPRK